MRSKFKVLDEKSIHFITSSTINYIPLFSSHEYKMILVDSLSYERQRERLKLYAYVVMNDHFHAILSSEHLTKLLKEFKSFTARMVIDRLESESNLTLLHLLSRGKQNHKLDSDFQVWQEGFHPQAIYGTDMFIQKAKYIHLNPVKKGYVKNPEDWIYSSASNFVKETGLMEIDSIF